MLENSFSPTQSRIIPSCLARTVLSSVHTVTAPEYQDGGLGLFRLSTVLSEGGGELEAIRGVCPEFFGHSMARRALIDTPHLAAKILTAPSDVVSFFQSKLPALFDWQITQECQLTCPHCYGRSYLSNPVIAPFGENELSFPEKMRVIDLLAARGVRTVCLSGGEPLLTHGIFEIIEHMKARNMIVVVNYNGLQIRRTPDRSFYVALRDSEGERHTVPLAT